MKKIYQLSPLLISKIAAGEVIERPSYAIKELIENAIDAQATDIKIYIEESGLKKIQIIDNGVGMSEEDIQESWKPHTTSKLINEAQLHAIKSFGFRGEALSSLGAVSKITIQSRTKKQQVGFQIIIENGKLLTSSPVGMAPGTVVVAEHLFANIPARKKFLKSSQTELRHIIDIVINFAVAYPSIRFSLTHGKRILLDYHVTKDISERLEQLVGTEIFSFFLPIKKSESYINLTGFIAKPQIHATTQSKQYLFINRRKVTDKLISQAVKEAFGTMLEATTYPQFVLFVSVPFELVDVNVHPRKEQVSFVNNQFIFQTIKQLISEVLTENNLTFQNLSWKRTGVGMTKSYAGNLLKEQVLDKENLVLEESSNLFQLNKLYIVCSTKQGLVLVDQHAAHERVLFEKLKKEFLNQKNKHDSFPLPNPFAMHFTQSELTLFEEYRKLLQKLGFKFEKENITHVPTIFQDRDPYELIKNILENLSLETGLQSIDNVSEEMLAFLACRSAVKAGDKLTNLQMEKILKELEATPNNITCPHGRPTKVVMTFAELDTKFGR